MKSFEGSFRNLNVSPSTGILLNFFFPFIGIRCLFSSLKLQYCGTTVLLNKLKLFKESCDFPPTENTCCPKAPHDFARFPAKKRWHSPPPSGCLTDPSPLPQSLYGRASADVTTKISRIDRLPDLFTHGTPQAPLKISNIFVSSVETVQNQIFIGICKHILSLNWKVCVPLKNNTLPY